MSTDEPTALTTVQSGSSIFLNAKAFAEGQRMVAPLAQSDLVPEKYKNRIDNCLIALELAQRLNTSPLVVMQNLDIIKGRPSWSSTYIISAINSSGRFSPVEFEYADLGKKTIEYNWIEKDWKFKPAKETPRSIKVEIEDKSCRVVTKSKNTGAVIYGTKITMEMAVKEGWYTKEGSKWKTMPDQMLAYRAAAFFGRIHIPEILMGMQTREEIEDMIDVTPKAEAKDNAADLNQAFNLGEGKESEKKKGKVIDGKQEKKGLDNPPPPPNPPSPRIIREGVEVIESQPGAGAPLNIITDHDKEPFPGDVIKAEQEARKGTYYRGDNAQKN